MTNHDLIYLADLNYAESIRETARWANHCEILEQDDLLLIAGGGLTPKTNSAIRLGNHAWPPAEEVHGKGQELLRQQETRLQPLCASASGFRS